MMLEMVISFPTSTTAGTFDTCIYSYDIEHTHTTTTGSTISESDDTYTTYTFYEDTSREEPETAQFVPLEIERNWDRWSYRCFFRTNHFKNNRDINQRWMFHGGTRKPRYGVRNFKKARNA
jgi:hypothetical protein